MKKRKRVNTNTLAQKMSTLELWQKQMAALQRASEPREENYSLYENTPKTHISVTHQNKNA